MILTEKLLQVITKLFFRAICKLIQYTDEAQKFTEASSGVM